jgi:fructoselysine-6-P-deglycase FrlB-like protein
MTYVKAEIASQPECWRQAAKLADAPGLPERGERVAVVGCGTSWFMAKSYAALREQAGQGETDAFQASEFPRRRRYDRVVAITRSGTTTEVLDLLNDLAGGTPTTVLTADETQPAARIADRTVLLDFADEQSVVQTRFATSTLTLLRAHLGEDAESLARQAEVALEIPIDDLLDADQCSFVGRGWAVGLTYEAALKTREAAQFWSESYPAMDYRHGPIAIAQPGRLVWSLGEAPAGLSDEVAQTGARFVSHDLDAQAGLVVAQRFAVGLAKARGLDPDNPRSLTRSVILA